MKKSEDCQDELEKKKSGLQKHERRYKHGGPGRTRKKKA